MTESQNTQTESFAELFEKTSRTIKEGEVVQGTVLSIDGEHVHVDVGFKSEGLIPLWELMADDGQVLVKPGDTLDVLIEETEDIDGRITLSKEKADRLKIWDDISRAFEADESVEGVIVARVKGGLSVDIGVKAFLPGSQVDLRPVRNLEALMGERTAFKIIKFNKRRGNIVLSRRALLEKERERQRRDTLQTLEVGQIVDGVIKNLTDYGAFIDLGGIDGLLHVTDMSWGRVNHPSDLFQVGDQLKVKVLKFDPETERVSLGLKQIQPDPWVDAAHKYPIGKRIQGKVVSLTDYGAFLELEPGIEGLVHVSEMSWTKRVKHPSKVVSVGDAVDSIVLDIDEGNRKISLGMKQIEPNPWSLIEEKYPVATRVRGTVRNITNFGIFVGLEEGIDGLVHVSDISWTEQIKHPGEKFEKGDEVEAVVLKIDKENEKFSLGIKQLQPNPWDDIQKRYPLGSEVEGEVTSIADFGAFVRLAEGIEGLIYTGELAAEPVSSPADVVKVGGSREGDRDARGSERAEDLPVDQGDPRPADPQDAGRPGGRDGEEPALDARRSARGEARAEDRGVGSHRKDRAETGSGEEMTKSGLIEKVAERTLHISKKDTEVVVNTIFDSMTDALRRGERIEIRGFGSFQVKIREARDGRNPKTGEMVNIPAKRTPFFKVGKELKEMVDRSSPTSGSMDDSGEQLRA
ncbi:MAG: 30S ribosomal protein S1 [Myxococcota bacterium]|nr:30S ribosomal protein S1 [Myxococcota bacterium]